MKADTTHNDACDCSDSWDSVNEACYGFDVASDVGARLCLIQSVMACDQSFSTAFCQACVLESLRCYASFLEDLMR